MTFWVVVSALTGLGFLWWLFLRGRSDGSDAPSPNEVLEKHGMQDLSEGEAPAGDSEDLPGILLDIYRKTNAGIDPDEPLANVGLLLDDDWVRGHAAATEDAVRSMLGRGVRTIAELQTLVRHSDARVRSQAIWALGLFGRRNEGGPALVEAVSSALADEEVEVRKQAVATLEGLNSITDLTPALSDLRQALGDDVATIRREVVALVAELGPSAAALEHELLTLLGDPEADVAQAAHEALIAIGGTPPLESELVRLCRLVQSHDNQTAEEAWQQLETMDESLVVPALRDTFRRQPGYWGRLFARYLLNRPSDDGLAALLEILDFAMGSQETYLIAAAVTAILVQPNGADALRSHVGNDVFLSVAAVALQHATVVFNPIDTASRRAADTARTVMAGTLSEEEADQVIEAIISPLRDSSRDDRDFYDAASALQAFGDRAFDALLESYRLARSSTVLPDGDIDQDDPGQDRPVAAALANLPSGLTRLHESMNGSDFERIVIVAHNYDLSSPPILGALAEIGTPVAVSRLFHAYRQSHWPPEWQQPVREALVSLGEKAHPRLLESLRALWSDSARQTRAREDALAILAQTGTLECIPTIQEVADEDPTVAQAANDTIALIKKRCGA